MPTSPTLRLDPAKVAHYAAQGIARMQRDDPEQFALLGDAVEAGGGGLFAVSLLSDGTVSVALAGVQLWRGPRAAVERGTERMFQ